ncbi:MAG TPA: hypothetical protein VF980_15650 [Thermoanaerobaculia bacterium]
MLIKRLFAEVRVYEGVAERTGVQFERDVVRRSGSCCRSVTELIRKAREAGDGYFYLPNDVWPADRERVEMQKRWVVIPSPQLPRPL